MHFEWKDEYSTLAKQFLELHFAGPQGVSWTFPCMRRDYLWSTNRPAVSDSRIPAKNNTEYHGLERHAAQYHATAQYEFSYHHWLLAAAWRRSDMKANDFRDSGHENAVRYCIKQALYNKALHEWQRSSATKPPTPEDFGLSVTDLEKKEGDALSEIERVLSNILKT